VSLLALSLAALAVPVRAQVTFKSGVDLVRFDLRVIDDAGRPITDLKPDEIVIEEGGRALPIMLFQRITEPGESYVDDAMRAVTAQVSSNEAFPRGHLYILIFDQEHITPGNEQRARMAAEQFVRANVRPSDRVALYAVPGPGPQIGFTADKARILQALPAVRGSYQRTVTTAFGTLALYEAHRLVEGDAKLVNDLLDRMRGEAGVDILNTNVSGAPGRLAASGEDPSITRRLLLENARVIVNQSDGASRQFLQRLADVVAQFRDIEGRKTVVLFSEGFFQANLSRELEEVAAAAAQSYCVFYTFDLNQRNAGLEEATAPETVRSSEIQARIAPLSTLAVETDGMMVVDASARTAAALQRVAAHTQDYYLLGFAPSEAARANRGKYQRVTVKVKRPGAHVSARTGYALRPEQSPADRKRAIENVLRAPFAQQGLKLDYTTYVMKALQPGRQRVVLSLNADLPVRSPGRDAADVLFVARDIRDGHVAATGADTLPLPAQPSPGAALGTGTWRVHFEVPPGSYMMRMVVREPGGLVGSADRRFDVHPLNGSDVTSSDLVVASALSGLPVRPRAYTDDGLTAMLEVYARQAFQLENVAARLELRPLDANESTRSVVADLRPVEEEDGRGATRKATFLMPLNGIAPGSYTAQAVVTARGEVVAERTRQVEVLAGPAPALTPGTATSVVPALEIVRGDLGRKFVQSLIDRAAGTPFATAAAHAREGRWEEVELAVRTADAGSEVAAALKGLTRFVRDDYDGAARALDSAFALRKEALTAFFLGWAHDGAGHPREAVSAWRNAAHIDPTLVSAHLALADAYLKLSQPALALQAVRAGLTALPSSPELQSKLRQLETIR
jgi:VWFA-related protein